MSMFLVFSLIDVLKIIFIFCNINIIYFIFWFFYNLSIICSLFSMWKFFVFSYLQKLFDLNNIFQNNIFY